MSKYKGDSCWSINMGFVNTEAQSLSYTEYNPPSDSKWCPSNILYRYAQSLREPFHSKRWFVNYTTPPRLQILTQEAETRHPAKRTTLITPLQHLFTWQCPSSASVVNITTGPSILNTCNILNMFLQTRSDGYKNTTSNCRQGNHQLLFSHFR